MSDRNGVVPDPRTLAMLRAIAAGRGQPRVAASRGSRPGPAGVSRAGTR
jgi:hypothetical protein